MGFLIDAVAHRVSRRWVHNDALLTDVYLAEIIVRTFAAG
jgi:hypothetical protein